MQPANLTDLFLIRTWEQFNEDNGQGPAWLLTRDGLWSDQVIVVRDGCLPRRPADTNTKTGDFARVNLREIWEEAEGLLPCGLPAVRFWSNASRLTYAPALIEDQLGRQAWMGYGYFSLLRVLSPDVVVLVVPYEAHPNPWRRFVPLADATGGMVGIVAQMNYSPEATAQGQGCDGPFPTGFMHAGLARAEAARVATARMIAARGQE